MRYLRRAAGSVSRLNCGLCRDRGIVRTSTTRPMPCAFRSRTKSSIDRVECPIVKMAVTVSHPCDGRARSAVVLHGPTAYCEDEPRAYCKTSRRLIQDEPTAYCEDTKTRRIEDFQASCLR